MKYEVLDQEISEQTGLISDKHLPSVSWYWMDQFLLDLDCSERSRKTTASNLQQFYSWMRSCGIVYPSRRDLMAFRDELMQRGLKPNTVKNYLVAAKSFLKWLEEKTRVMHGICPAVPILEAPENVKNPKLPKGTSKIAPSVRDVQRMIDYYSEKDEKSLRNRAVIALLAGTGIRTHSLSLARYGDLRADSGQKVLWYKGKGRDDYDQFVKIPPALDDLIREYLSVRFGDQKIPLDAPLFASTAPRSKGEGISTRTVSGIVKEALRAIGEGNNPRLTAHSLRHFFGTQTIETGGTIDQAMDVLGHSNPKQTLHYVHSLNRKANSSEQRVVDLILNTDVKES